MKKLKIKSGDEVLVITGKYKGQKGKVLKIYPDENKALVSGVNVVSKHTKPSSVSGGGIVQKELPVHISNLSHIDPKSGKPTKVGFIFLSDGRKVRVAKKSGEIIEDRKEN
jgi:large subunit ribosomal protein L24